MPIPTPVHATTGTGTTTPAATAATIAASGPTSTSTINQPLVGAIAIVFVLICTIVIGLSIYLRGRVDQAPKMFSKLHAPSWSSNQQGTQQVSWERAPDGAETVTLYPGQWSSTLELQFEHSWNLHFDSDVTLVLNGSNVVSLGRDQRVPSNDNIHTIKVRNNGRVKMTYIVTYGAPYRTPRYYHQQVQQPPERRYYANPQYNSPRYYRLSYKRY